jgi:hypothetical protein
LDELGGHGSALCEAPARSVKIFAASALPQPTDITGLILDTGKSRGDYPRQYKSELSTNGTEWEKPQLQGNGQAGVIGYLFAKPTKAKSIRISQLDEAKGSFWSIH